MHTSLGSRAQRGPGCQFRGTCPHGSNIRTPKETESSLGALSCGVGQETQVLVQALLGVSWSG